MVTFLPYPDYAKSAQCLDRARLGKQRVECLQILNVLVGNNQNAAWRNHPAALMWKGYESALVLYTYAICDEWTSRGYTDTVKDKVSVLVIANPGPFIGWVVHPPWIGNEAFHASHRSRLLAKDPNHYKQFGWTEPDNLEYVWPVRKE